MMLTVEERLARCHQGTAWMGSLIKQQLTELADLLATSEQSDAESITMYRKARDERDALRTAVRHEADCVEAAMAEIKSLRAKLETAENDAAHQKALAASALRVAEGWERKCGELRAALRHEADCVEAAKAEIDALRSKITEMEKRNG